MKNKLLFILVLIFFTSCENDDINTPDIPEDYVAKYALNGNAVDDSKYRNHGEIFGTVFPISNRNGIKNSAMYFTSDIAYLDVGDVSELKLVNSITISVWVKAANSQNGWKTIVNKSGGAYYLGINPDGTRLTWNVSNRIVEMETSFPLNEWLHIAVTYNGSILKMYLNGEIIGESQSGGEIRDTPYPFRIGQRSDYVRGSTFSGAIDDVIIYNRALDKSEIDKLFKENS